jgi:hypothetical protein
MVLPCASIGRMFFFEKKNQKTLGILLCAAQLARDNIKKFFVSFLKKEALAFPLPTQSQPW